MSRNTVKNQEINYSNSGRRNILDGHFNQSQDVDYFNSALEIFKCMTANQDTKMVLGCNKESKSQIKFIIPSAKKALSIDTIMQSIINDLKNIEI